MPDLLTATTAHNELRLFAGWYCFALFMQLSLGLREQARYLRALPSPAAPPLPRILGLVRVPPLSPRAADILGFALLLALAAALVGVAPRFSLALAVVLYFLYFGQLLNLGTVIRKTNTIPQTLLVLAVAPGLTAPLTAANFAWPLELIRVLVAIVYFASGLAKLRGGLGWVHRGRTLQAYLLEHALLIDAGRGRALAERPTLCRVLSIATLAWELGTPLILIAPALAPAWVACALVFHLGTRRTMAIDYLKYTGIVLPVFLTAPLLDVWWWLRSTLGVA